MRRHGFLLAIAGVVVVALLVIGMWPSTPPTPRPNPSGLLGSEIVSLTEPVTVCAERPLSIPAGRVQVLLDASGSMLGVRQSVLMVVPWIEQTLSRLRGSAVDITEIGAAQFDRHRGILSSQSLVALSREYKPSGQTNLHEAIRSSRDFDLTFIVTDGVAAAGSGSGDCASGVDAACVARALRDAIHLDQTSSNAPDPGIWIVPLWARHSGPFYTERPTTPAEFDVKTSLQSVHGEVALDVSISNARVDNEKNLVFDYAGPRGLLLIVIAHSADLGRQAIIALNELMAENRVAAVQSLKGESSKLGALDPIEVYPGYMPRAQWNKFEELDERPDGTIEATLKGSTVAVDCAAGRLNQASFSLVSKRALASSRCIPVHQMPSFEFAFVGATPRDQGGIEDFIAKYDRTAGANGDQFLLRLQCGKGAPRPCGTDPVRAQWVAQSRYDRSGGKSASSANTLIGSIATADLVRQPHRIYGLDSLLSIFFDEVQKDRRQIVISDVDFCNGIAEAR